VVNWSTSLRTPPDVLEEWQRQGFSGAASAEYRRGFDLVEERLGINTEDSAPNRNNAALQRGCATLGYHWRSIPRNAAGCAQRCGACGFGCPYGRKQSTLKTYLQDASDHGARTLPWCRAERVLIEAGRATGVEGWALNPATGRRHRVTARAPLVVVAAGAVESPALLLRSGLAHPHIGRHLRLHPVMAMVGYYDEPIEAWSGSLQTVLCDHFAQLKDGYGVRIELAPAHPGLFAVAAPWSGGQAHKELMTRARYAATFIVLTRDTGEGRVTLDPQGDPVLHYWPNQTDRYRLLRGAREVARIAAAGGANGVATLHTPQLELRAARGLDRRRLEGFEQQMMRRGIQPNRVPLFSAHQMGTCRIGASPRAAVANPGGQVYGVRGLYIADASAFPTASGVNPMISVMALAHHVARILSR
jgi:choline dehydrogenase-like flavoprotein